MEYFSEGVLIDMIGIHQHSIKMSSSQLVVQFCILSSVLRNSSYLICFIWGPQHMTLGWNNQYCRMFFKLRPSK
jgi:hypothetical protein